MSLLRALIVFALININSAQDQEQCNCTYITVSAEDCTSDDRSSGLHSPCNDIGYSGDTAILWQQFNITVTIDPNSNETNSSMCMLDLIAEWERTLRLNHTTDLQYLSQTLLVNSDNSGYVVLANASLTLLDIQNQPDTDSEYGVTLTVQNCIGKPPKRTAQYFSLEVKPSCDRDVPTPVKSTYTVTYTDPLQCPFMNVTFIGGDRSVNAFVWQNPDGEMICFTSGVIKMMGRYTCGWTVIDENSCNNTAWLKIDDCEENDDGNYSVYSDDGSGVSQSAHVLLSFQETEMQDTGASKQGIIAGSVSAFLLLLLIAGTVIIIVVCVLRNNLKQQSITTFAEIIVQTTGNDSKGGNLTQAGGTIQICTRMAFPDKQLTRDELIHIAKEITDWKVLARHLGLSEPDITAIESNDPKNYKEQTFKMLLEWLQQQDCPPTRKDFVQIIEEKMGPVLAGNINSVFVALEKIQT